MNFDIATLTEAKGLSLQRAYQPKSNAERDSIIDIHKCIACDATQNFLFGDVGPKRQLGDISYFKVACRCQCGYMNFIHIITNDLPSERGASSVSAAEAIENAKNEQLLIDYQLEELLQLSAAEGFKQNYEASQEIVEYCIEHWPESEAAWFNMGCLLRNLGKAKEAEDAFKKVLTLGDGFPSAHMNLGHIYEGDNNFELAVEAYNSFLKVFPSHQSTKERMVRCQEALDSSAT